MIRNKWQFTGVGLVCAFSMWSSACVSQATYEEARSAAEVEREAARRAEVALNDMRRQVDEVRRELDKREAFLQEQERKLAESDLDLKLAHQERDATGNLVTQLRGELARVGDHLRVYSEEKQRLAGELEAAENRARVLDSQQAYLREFALLVQNISLLEASAMRTGAFTLTTVDQNPALEVPAPAMAPGGQLGTDGKRLVKTLARLLVLHPDLKLVVSQKSSNSDGRSSLPDIAVLRQVVAALSAEGVDSSRVILDVAEAGKPEVDASSPDAEASIVIVFQITQKDKALLDGPATSDT